MNRDVVIAEWRRSTETLAAADLLVREDYAGAGITLAAADLLLTKGLTEDDLAS